MTAAIVDSLLECNWKGRRAEEIFAEETKHQAWFQTKTKLGPQRYHIAPPLLSRTLILSLSLPLSVCLSLTHTNRHFSDPHSSVVMIGVCVWQK